MLTSRDERIVVGEARDGNEALRKLGEGQWDVVLLDISLPGKDGIQTLKRLKKVHPKIPVLMLTAHPVERFAVRAIRAGAAGYLSKDTAPEELLSAVRRVWAGELYVTVEVAEQLIKNVAPEQAQPPHEILSDREYEILRDLGRGESVSSIARNLSLSIGTIGGYRTRILKKLGLRGAADLMHYAVRHKLLD